MTRLTSLLAKSLFALLIASGGFATDLQAQSDAITVTVPFPFTVGGWSIAPGTYEFSLISNQFRLSVRDLKTGHMEMFNVRPEQERTLEERGRLTFHNSAGRSVLNEVHFPGADTFSELILRQPARRTATMQASTGN